MDLAGKVAVVTGSGNGLGEAVARWFAAAGARVLVTDVEPESVARVAAELETVGLAVDITVEANVRQVAALAEERLGPVDVWYSNAGISGPRAPGKLQDNQLWDTMWRLHVLSHVYAARTVLPSMLARGDGYLVATASSIALSLQAEKLAYSVTKRAALALSEWLAANFRPRGIKVSCVCPGAMLTRMIAGDVLGPGSAALASALTPEQAAEIVLDGLRDERFLIVTRPGTENALREKAADYDGWLDASFASFAEFTGQP